ncbi:MAG: serine protease [Bacteroidaceae bacterium]|nr:serine protease [Bacteroidaceae bacterium]
MKNIVLILLSVFSLTVAAQTKAPKWMHKLRNASFSIVTYDKEGNILKNGNGFFITKEGTALADFSLFKDAVRASVITYKGDAFPVEEIMGGSSIYDVIKFKVATKKKNDFIPLATQTPAVGSTVYLMPYTTYKGKTVITGKVTDLTEIPTKKSYFTLALPYNEKNVSCALLNENGEAVALLQRDSSGGEKSFAIGTDYAASLSIRAISSNNSALEQLAFKKSLPNEEEEALIYLYMQAGKETPQEQLTLIEQFIHQFPESSEGYLRRASQFVHFYRDNNHFDQAADDLDRALKLSKKKENVHYNFAQLIMVNSQLTPAFNYKGWTLDKALEENSAALAIDSLPVYQQQRAEIYVNLKNYPEAYRWYEKVNASSLGSAEISYKLVQLKEIMGGSQDEILALLDSTIQRLPNPVPSSKAIYLIKRAEKRVEKKLFREAVKDYNTYYDAMNGNVNHLFYYFRSQAEINSR